MAEIIPIRKPSIDGYCVIDGKPTNVVLMEEMLEGEKNFSPEVKAWIADDILRKAVDAGVPPDVAGRLY